MYAGVGTGQTSLNGLILFTAKANRLEYHYIARNGFYDSTKLGPAKRLSSQNVIADSSSPSPGTTANGVSLPSGTIELKAAWRELTTAEAGSGRFYQTRVRYYPTDSTYVDTTMGLVALHIIHKTPGRPSFVFATFEQADNILSATGERVEDEQGNLNPGYDTLPPMDLGLTIRNATQPGANGYTKANIQHLTATSTPGKRLYYVNTPNRGEPDGIISVNQRVHGIPQTIIEANEAAHRAMEEYSANYELPPAVWQYYKLINVQYQPINKPALADSAAADSATYYLANSVVETDHNLQSFSGRFQPSFIIKIDTSGTRIDTTTVSGGTRITDWCGSNAVKPIRGCPQPPDAAANGPIYNVYTGGNAYNMGGCMGCHGNAQVGGGDFSFLVLGGGVKTPEPANAERAPLNTQKFPELVVELTAVREAARASPAGTQ
ncbi:MAG TPA: hypothetical protein VGX50_02340, partial [Longimicrobium sp.]|nr:hypothetical protein [Longimicrobium sp.]